MSTIQASTTFQDFVVDEISKEEGKIDSVFVREFAFSLDSKEQFPIPIEKLITWEVNSQKKHAIARLDKAFVEDRDFSRTFGKSTGGRPAKIIMLTVECFKSMCMIAQNDKGKQVREYYLVLERLFKKYIEIEFQRQRQEIEALQQNLLQEQKDGIRTKKCLRSIKLKYHHQHKFSSGPCIYVITNPAEMQEKHKFGIAGTGEFGDVNSRLASHRTMAPNLKVKLIMYTPHCKIFEDVVKIRYHSRLEQPSHEWIFEPIDKLVQVMKEINTTCGFESVEDTSLWRYNMEDPPVLVPIQEVEPESIDTRKLKFDHLYERLHRILPTYLIRADLIRKNEDAPREQKYCNGFCQAYRPLSTFATSNKSTVSVCTICQNMEDIATVKMLNGELTADQIRKDPSLIALQADEKICRCCRKILKTSDFEHPKRKCRKCRYSNTKMRVDQFDNYIEEDIVLLRSLPECDRLVKIKGYVKDQLIKLMKRLKTGRKSSDKKDAMVEKLMDYFSS